MDTSELRHYIHARVLQPRRRRGLVRSLTDCRSSLASRARVSYLLNSLRSLGRVFDDSLLRYMLRAYTAGGRRRLLGECLRNAQKLGLRADTVLPPMRDATGVEILLGELFEEKRMRPFFHGRFVERLESLQQGYDGRPVNDRLSRRLSGVAQTFGLTGAQAEVVLFCYLYETDGLVDQVYESYAEACGNKAYGLDLATQRRAIAAFCGLSPADVGAAVSDAGPLLLAGRIPETYR